MLTAALGAAAGGLLIGLAIMAISFRLVVTLNREERDHLRADHERDREAWRAERRELVTRATHPHLVPTAVKRTPVNPEDLAARQERAREMASVGRIVHGPPIPDDDDLPGVP